MNEYKIDDRKLAKLTGVSFPTIARLRNNAEVNPTATVLLSLAKFFGITVSQLLGEVELKKPEIYLENEIFLHDHKIKYIPLILWDDIIKYTIIDIDNHNKYIVTEQNISNQSFAVEISNNDYGLILRNGSIIIVDTKIKCVLNDLILLNFNAIILICKVIYKNELLFLKPLNGLIGYLQFHNNNYNIIGNIVEIRYSTTI